MQIFLKLRGVTPWRYKAPMTRRTLLATAAAALGVPVVAKEVAKAPSTWTWLGKPVVRWKIWCNTVTGAYMRFEGTDLAGHARSWATLEKCYPMAAGNVHREQIWTA